MSLTDKEPPKTKLKRDCILRIAGYGVDSACDRANYIEKTRGLDPLVFVDRGMVMSHMDRLDTPCPVEFDPTKIRACLGFVRNKKDQIVGGCFKIAPRCIMTCYHVYATAGQDAIFDFPFLGGKVKNPRVARVCGNFDIIILTFEQHGGQVDGDACFMKIQAKPTFIDMKHSVINELPVFLNMVVDNAITHPVAGVLRQFYLSYVLHTIQADTRAAGFPLIDANGVAFAIHRASSPEQCATKRRGAIAVRFDVWLRYDFFVGDDSSTKNKADTDAFLNEHNIELYT